MSSIFDLEQGILRCWNVTDDISEIAADLESGHMDTQEAAQALRAYERVYQRRFERCFDQFELHCAEVRDLRQRSTDLDLAPGKRAKSKGKKAVDQ